MRARLALVLVVFACSCLSFANEAPEFFQTFAAATANFEQGRTREAAAILQALGQRLQGSPWRESALLKTAELQESFDRAAAAKNYEEVVTRTKDRISDRTLQILFNVASRGLQRLETAEIEEALKKYYLGKVEYPPSLEALVQTRLLTDDKIRDAAGKLYAYSTGVEKLIPTVPRQTYALEKSPSPPFLWKGAKVVGIASQAAVVQWSDAPSKSLRAGEKVEELEVLSVLDNGVILGNDARLVVLSYK